MSGDFAGRHVFVTGAAKGIGRATARRLLEAGAHVGCFDLDRAGLAELASGHSGRVWFQAGDITVSSEVDAAVDACAAAFGRLDGLVNCAGVDLLRPLEETDDATWRRVFAVNLDGAMHVCRAGLKHLRAAGGGTIVNVSSGAGLQPLRHRTAYSASKAALQMLSKALAMEAAAWNVRVNAVCPGAVETELFRSSLADVPDPAAAEQAVRARYSLGRIADPDEIAAAILWLSGPGSSYVTGVALAVDGGRTFH